MTLCSQSVYVPEREETIGLSKNNMEWPDADWPKWEGVPRMEGALGFNAAIKIIRNELTTIVQNIANQCNIVMTYDTWFSSGDWISDFFLAGLLVLYIIPGQVPFSLEKNNPKSEKFEGE